MKTSAEQILSLEEMTESFPGEWLLVGDPLTNEKMDVVSGRVIHHSKDRDEIYRKAVALRPKRSAVLFTGELPADTAVVV